MNLSAKEIVFMKISVRLFLELSKHGLFVCLFVCLYRPWILHPVWIIHPVLGFIGFSLKPKVLGVCNAPTTFHLVFQRFLGLGEGTIKKALIPTFLQRVKPNTTPSVI